jgi:hypothetical protein
MHADRKDAAPICTARDNTAAMRSARKHALAAIRTARDAAKREEGREALVGGARRPTVAGATQTRSPATDVLVSEPQP